MSKFGSYFLPTSLTWWAGLLAIATGLAQYVWHDPAASDMARLVASLVGQTDQSPVGLILYGLGAIGARGAIERALTAQRAVKDLGQIIADAARRDMADGEKPKAISSSSKRGR